MGAGSKSLEEEGSQWLKQFLGGAEKEANAPLSSIGEQVSPEAAQSALEEAQRSQAANAENIARTPTEPVNTAEQSAKTFEENPPQAPAIESAEAFKEKTPKELELDKADQEPKINPSAEQETPDLKSDINPSEEQTPSPVLDPNTEAAMEKIRPGFKNLTTKQKIAAATAIGLGGTALYNSMQTPPTVSSDLLKQKYDKPPETSTPASSKEPSKTEEQTPETPDASTTQEPTKPSEQPSIPNLNLSSSFNPNQALTQAINRRESELAGNQFGRGADIISAALTRQQPVLEKYYDEQDKMAGRFIEDVKNKIAVQQDDPNSQVSQGFRNVAAKLLGKDVPPNVSASTLTKIMPSIAKIYTNQEVTNRQEDLLKQRIASQEKIAGMKKGDKQTQTDEKTAQNITKSLNGLSASSRSALGRAAQANVSINRLVDIANNPNSTSQDLSSAAADLNQVVSGASTIAGAKHQEYVTLAGDFSKAMQYITSNPKSPNVPLIKKHLVDVATRMKKISDDVLNQNTKMIQAGNQAWIQRHPDQWKDMLSATNGQPNSSSFPKQVSNGTHTAIVKNQEEADAAAQKGFK